MKRDEYYMRLAITEARKGLGRTSPNPCVGAVVVKNNVIISRGYHKRAGTPHAEVHALRKAGSDAKGATIYVTLEPCNHTGRTPPCSHAIVASGIHRVVVGMTDPNPLVNGSGIDHLSAHGIEVDSGVLAEDCRQINLPFIKYIKDSLPLVVMKAGLSLDGKITYQKGRSGWITGPESSSYTHKLRNTYDAIMVGSGTVLIDDPSLTTRLHESSPRGDERIGRDPIRVILDTHLSIPVTAKVFQQQSDAPTWVFCGPRFDDEKKALLATHGVEIFPVGYNETGGLNLRDVLSFLGTKDVLSVLVEGGAQLHGALLKNRMVDHIHLFKAPLIIGDEGVSLVDGFSANGKEDAISLCRLRYKRLGDDLLVEGQINYPSEE